MVNLCFHYIATSGKQVLDPNGTYINVSDYSKKCLSVGNFGILSVVVCSLYRVCSLHQLILVTHSFTFWYIDMADVFASYGWPFDLIAFLGIFINYWRVFMSKVLYFRQTFTDYVSDQCIRMSTWQMWLLVKKNFYKLFVKAESIYGDVSLVLYML